MRTVIPHRLLLFSLLLGTACSTTLGDRGLPDRPMMWPTESPRVQLDRYIGLRSHHSGKRVGRWLAGAEEAPLFARPYGVAWDGDDLLVTDPGAGRVLRLRGDGKIVRSPDGLLDGPIGVAACSRGVVVTDARAGRVALLDDDLELRSWVAENLHRPTGVVCLDDRVFVVETGAHRVVAFAADGSRSVFGRRGVGAGEYNFPAALAPAGPTGLWVGDTLNFRLQRIDAGSGAQLGFFGQLGDAVGETPRIKGIAIDVAGRIWISDAYLDTVMLYTPEGVFLMEVGSPGSAPGEFAFPAGIAAHADGRVAVVDSLNRRIQVFSLIDNEGISNE